MPQRPQTRLVVLALACGLGSLSGVACQWGGDPDENGQRGTAGTLGSEEGGRRAEAGDRAQGAKVDAARSAPRTADYHGPWSVRVFAVQPSAEGPMALAAGLAASPQAWSSGPLPRRRGELAVLWLDPGAELPPVVAALRGPGEAVVVLGPGDETWAQEAAVELPWAGAGVVAPQQTASLLVASGELSGRAAGALAATVLAEHYDLAYVPVELDLPPGLAERVGPTPAAALEDPDSRRRTEAAWRTSSPPASLAEDPQVAVRLAAAARVESPAVAQLASDPDPLVRARAVDRLTDLPLLAARTDDPSSVVRVHATHHLATLAMAGRIEPVVVDALVRAAASPDAYQRWKAAAGLGAVPSATPQLIDLLSDPDIDVRREAARSLGRHRGDAVVDALLTALEDPNSFVRRWAARGLGELGDRRAVDALLAAAKDPTALVAREAAHALKNMGHDVLAPPFQPPRPPRDDEALRGLLASPDATVRKDACKFVGGREDAAELVAALLEDPDSEVRKAAVEALGWAPEHAALLSRAASDPDPDTAVTALDAMRRAGAGELAPVLALVDHADAELRLRAVEALAALPRDAAGDAALARRATDPDERIRAAAVGAMPETLDPGEPSVLVRRAAGAAGRALPGEVDDLVLAVTGTDPDRAAWAQGVIVREDDLLHLRFSWNREADHPPSHAALRPPVVRPYGHPNRG